MDSMKSLELFVYFSTHAQLLVSFEISFSTPELVVSIWGTSAPRLKPMSPISLTSALGSGTTNGLWRKVSGWIAKNDFLHAVEVLVLVTAESVKDQPK